MAFGKALQCSECYNLALRLHCVYSTSTANTASQKQSRALAIIRRGGCQFTAACARETGSELSPLAMVMVRLKFVELEVHKLIYINPGP